MPPAIRRAVAFVWVVVGLGLNAQQTVTGSNIPGSTMPSLSVLYGDYEHTWDIRKPPGHDKLPEEYRWEDPPRWTGVRWPVFPYELLQRQERGRVGARFIIDEYGRVTVHEILSASTAEFRHAVVSLLEAAKFAPAKRRGQACKAILGLVFIFEPAFDQLVPAIPPDVNPAGAPVLWTRDIKEPPAPSYRSESGLLRDIEKQRAKIVAARELDTQLKPMTQIPPVFPAALAKTKAKGAAEVEVIIDREGRVRLPRIVSATAPEFGYAAAQAVAQWRFEPPRSKGKKMHVRVVVPFEFQRDASKEP